MLPCEMKNMRKVMSLKMEKSIGFGASAPLFFASSAAAFFASSSLNIIVGRYRADAVKREQV